MQLGEVAKEPPPAWGRWLTPGQTPDPARPPGEVFRGEGETARLSGHMGGWCDQGELKSRKPPGWRPNEHG